MILFTFHRWKRRHFVLTDDLLEYWDRVADYALGREGKTFFLSGSCMTSFTSTQNCLCVSNPATDANDSNSWYLLADSERYGLLLLYSLGLCFRVFYMEQPLCMQSLVVVYASELEHCVWCPSFRL